ncbi:MAG: hypothetical protein NUK65_00800 [Firmicutes bacterium]|nr:hypothetical protein [Bacillota bacterium]
MRNQVVHTTAATEIENVVTMLTELFTQVEQSFSKHRLSLKHKQTTARVTTQMRGTLTTLHQLIGEINRDEALAVQATVLNVGKVYYSLLRLSYQVEKKVEDNIVFTKVAADDMHEILQRTRALLPHVNDTLRTCNTVLATHVKEEVDVLLTNAESATKLHEERLCTGVCHPNTANIYLQMLAYLQDILWHMKALVCENGLPII